MAEHFEPTMRTWIGDRLALGERGLFEVRTHIAETYALPLQVYYRATSWFRSNGGNPDWSPETVVHHFLADRLSKDAYLRRWLDSGLRLRRWLVTGLNLFLREYFRAVAGPGSGAGGAGDAGLSSVPVEEEAGLEADRVMVVGLVRRAIALTVEGLEADGQSAHARAFVASSLEMTPVREVAEALGLSEGQVKGMLRLARSRFRAVFLDLLARDGIPPHRLDAEVQAIMEIVNA